MHGALTVFTLVRKRHYVGHQVGGWVMVWVWVVGGCACVVYKHGKQGGHDGVCVASTSHAIPLSTHYMTTLHHHTQVVLPFTWGSVQWTNYKTGRPRYVLCVQ